MNELKNQCKEKILIRACHKCMKLSESFKELERCTHCGKAFLPLHYFEKIHDLEGKNWQRHFSNAEDLEDEDLIKGLFVLW